MKKGLRPISDVKSKLIGRVNRSPDEEGITTVLQRDVQAAPRVNRSPDEEGITT